MGTIKSPVDSCILFIFITKAEKIFSELLIFAKKWYLYRLVGRAIAIRKHSSEHGIF